MRRVRAVMWVAIMTIGGVGSVHIFWALRPSKEQLWMIQGWLYEYAMVVLCPTAILMSAGPANHLGVIKQEVWQTSAINGAMYFLVTLGVVTTRRYAPRLLWMLVGVAGLWAMVAGVLVYVTR